MTAACVSEPPTATQSRFPSSRSRGHSKLSPMTETRTSLLRRVRNPADSASWAEFVGLYEPLLMAYVRQRGLDEHDARDVVQSIFITLCARCRPSSWTNRGADSALGSGGSRTTRSSIGAGQPAAFKKRKTCIARTGTKRNPSPTIG